MFRIGLGYDIHKVNHTLSTLYLGGVPFKTSFGLEGHSDADVLLHSITDALLGAMNKGDIGTLFPDTHAENKNQSSVFFVKKVLTILDKQQYKILNIDTNIICEKPKIQPIKYQIQQSISSILKISIEQVSIKAKTNEGLDSIGQCQAIAVQTIVLLQKNNN